MPWVLKDYTSTALDLDDAQRTYRDLSKPIGAQVCSDGTLHVRRSCTILSVCAADLCVPVL